MIYLAASDLDGTLFDSKGRLPARFWEDVEALRQKGVTFAVASGRSYAPLRRLFGENHERLTYVCDNGACVVEHGEIIYRDTLSREKTRKLIKAFLAYNETRGEQEKMTILLCGVHGTYHMDYGEAYAKNIAAYYDNQCQMEDLTQVDDEIYKAALYDPLDPQTGSHAHFAALFEDMSFQVSGRYWMDVMNAGTDKGKAIRMLAKRKGVSRNQIAAFGDFYNDVSLFREADYSYAMENGDVGVRQYARFVAPSNDKNGVMTLLRQLCGLDQEEPLMNNRITHANERAAAVGPSKAGGVGNIIIESLLSDAQRSEKTRMYAKVTIPTGCAIAFHEHHGESETYYILSGEGEYNDNGSIVTVRSGDVTYTPDGFGHGMSNNAPEDLVFVALIQIN